MRVTSKYGLSEPVPFVNVHVDRDNALYIDPSAIRNGRDLYSRRAQKLLISYFTEVLRCRRSTAPSDQQDGLALLQNLHEPNQTRLGVSRVGIGGKALGPGLADELWDELGTNKAAQFDAMTRLEHLPVYLERVGPDLISDLTTRVVFEVLVDFTHEMVRTYPSLGAGLTIASEPIYNLVSMDWVPTEVELPFTSGHQLLLIPRGWVYWRLLMWSEPFYNRFATTTVQLERSTVDAKGVRRGPLKKALHEEFPNRRKLNNEQAVKYKQSEGRDLILEYQTLVDGEFEPMSESDIDGRIG